MTAGDPLDDGYFVSFDTSKPNIARVYDAMLGGKDNFAADRDFVAEAMRIAPKAPLAARANSNAGELSVSARGQAVCRDCGFGRTWQRRPR